MVTLLLICTYIHPEYIPNDSTPFYVNFSKEGLVGDTLYYAKIRIKTDDDRRNYHGYTYNPETERWCGQRTAWSSHPVLRTDEEGRLQGWLKGMLAGDTDVIDSLKVVLRLLGDDRNIELPFVEVHTGEGGVLHGYLYEDGSYERVLRTGYVLLYTGSTINGIALIEEGYFLSKIPECRVDSLRVLSSSLEGVDFYTYSSPPWYVITGDTTFIGSSAVGIHNPEDSFDQEAYDVLGRKVKKGGAGFYFYRTKRGYVKDMKLRYDR